MLEVGLRVASAIRERRAREVMNASGSKAGEYWAIFDPDLGYRGNPNFGGMNSDGLRDHPISPKAGRFRVLQLGDSIAYYGDNVEDTFVGHLRADLARRPNLRPVDVVNAGIPGYTNYQELLYLKKYGLSFQPDLVAIEFCLNDLHKFLHSFRVENGRILPGTYQFSAEALSKQRSRPSQFADKSYLWAWTKNNVRTAGKVAAWMASGGFSFDYAVDIGSAWRDEAWKDIESQLGEMLALGREHRFRVFVALVPVAAQYNNDYLKRDRAYVLKPQQKLKEICERLGIDFYDLYPEMSAALFKDDGIHLTKEGRQLVGQRIADFLVQSHLLPIISGTE
jgi:lysophospholipase L1-like esterase